MFSGPNKLAFLSYIPVDEDFIINTADSSLALKSDLGPFRAKFKGHYKWRADSNEMDFAFDLAQACIPLSFQLCFIITAWLRECQMSLLVDSCLLRVGQ